MADTITAPTTGSTAFPKQVSRREPLLAAYIWLLVFIVIYLARPEDWIPGLSAVPLAKIAGILAFIALALAIGKVRQKFAPEVIYLIFLFGQLWLTVPFSPVWRGGAFQGVSDFSKVVVIVLVMVLSVRTVLRLRYVILIQAASVAVLAAVSVWKGNYYQGRLSGFSSTFSNPNDLALIIVVSLPLCLVFLFRSRSRLRKAAWAAGMLVMTYAVFRTSSRAGLISLIIAAGICLWEFAVKGRRRYLLVVVGVVGVVFMVFFGSGVMSRLGSAAESDNPEDAEAVSAEEVSAAQSTALRRNLLIESLKVTAQHPLFGVGPGNFTVVSGWRVTHNSYTQMSSEGGVPALVLYVLILWHGFLNLRSTKRLAGTSVEVKMLASGLRASLAAFVLGAFFASVAYQFFTYFLAFYTTVLYQIARGNGLVTDREPSRSARRDPERTKLDPAVRADTATCDKTVTHWKPEALFRSDS
jgi:putative inorganic carbon (HCO3(-)) transporter